MATLVSALDTEFTPAAGDFIAQSGGGLANLLRKNTSGASWALVATLQGNAKPLIVSNPVAGAVYQFTSSYGTPTVQADQ